MSNFNNYIDSQKSGFRKGYYGLLTHKFNHNNKTFNVSALERLVKKYKVSFQGTTLIIPELNFKCSGRIVKEYFSTVF